MGTISGQSWTRWRPVEDAGLGARPSAIISGTSVVIKQKRVAGMLGLFLEGLLGDEQRNDRLVAREA